MHRVCVMTGTRADYGLLKRTMERLEKCSDIELKIAVCGTHLLYEYGHTVEEIIADGFVDYDEITFSMCEDGKIGMAESVALGIQAFSEYFRKTGPELFVVLGDRYEAYAASSAAFMNGIPIAHISGGDITEGAIDDIFRHCITKMSVLHFTGCEQSKGRVLRMGEQYVYNVGEPGVENALYSAVLNRDELANEIGFDGIARDYALVTFHPATKEGGKDTAIRQARELMKAMDVHSDLFYVVTLANADTAGDVINDAWKEYGSSRKNVYIVASLGVKRYMSAMKYCKFVLGNSSSGIVEAPSFKIPTVNVGSRQQGRMLSDSVISCNPNCEDISKAITKALSPDFVESIANVESMFGNGDTSRKIADTVIEHLRKGKLPQKMSFNDIGSEI